MSMYMPYGVYEKVNSLLPSTRWIRRGRLRPRSCYWPYLAINFQIWRFLWRLLLWYLCFLIFIKGFRIFWFRSIIFPTCGGEASWLRKNQIFYYCSSLICFFQKSNENMLVSLSSFKLKQNQGLIRDCCLSLISF